MASETSPQYLSLNQDNKLRIPTYQAEIEPAIFIIHSQANGHKIRTKYKKLRAQNTQAVVHTLKFWYFRL
jgi:hypothetical protein